MPRQEERKSHNFKVNDLVLVKDPCSAVFELRYQPNYRVTAIFGGQQDQSSRPEGTQIGAQIFTRKVCGT